MINEAEYVPVPGGSSRDSDALHHTLQEHVSKCRQCTEIITRGKPRGFGQTSQMCQEYQEIIQMFATGTTL